MVTHLCLSSCANYLFVAGRWKSVLRESYVGFHGGLGPTDKVVYEGPEELRAWSLAAARPQREELVRQQDAFFRSLGVDPRLVDTAPAQPPPSHDWEHEFWEYGPSRLTSFGVRGVGTFWTPADRTIGDALSALYWTVRCDPAGSDAWMCKA